MVLKNWRKLDSVNSTKLCTSIPIQQQSGSCKREISTSLTSVDRTVVEQRMATMLQQTASSAAKSGGTISQLSWGRKDNLAGSSTGGGLVKKVLPSLRVLRRLSSVDEYDTRSSSLIIKYIHPKRIYRGHFYVRWICSCPPSMSMTPSLLLSSHHPISIISMCMEEIFVLQIVILSSPSSL